MTPDEVLKIVDKMGICASRSSLLRFEKAGLVPQPKRGAGGRGVGRFSDYPEDAPLHFFASWWTIKSEGITLKKLADLLPIGRKFYQDHEEKREQISNLCNCVYDNMDDFDSKADAIEERFPHNLYEEYAFSNSDISREGFDDNKKRNIIACRLFQQWNCYYVMSDCNPSVLVPSIMANDKNIKELWAENEHLKTEIQRLKDIISINNIKLD